MEGGGQERGAGAAALHWIQPRRLSKALRGFKHAGKETKQVVPNSGHLWVVPWYQEQNKRAGASVRLSTVNTRTLPN